MGNMWQGRRIRLRAVEMSDLENYFCREEQPDTDGERAGDRVLFPVSIEKMRERVEWLSKKDPYGYEYFLIIEDDQGNPIGNINTHSVSRIDGTFEYGLGVAEPYRGRGYAGEAVEILLRFFFNELGFQKAGARVYSFNTSSISLHEKLGFKLEGRLRRAHFANGDWHDILCFGMLKDEFYQKHGK